MIGLLLRTAPAPAPVHTSRRELAARRVIGRLRTAEPAPPVRSTPPAVRVERALTVADRAEIEALVTEYAYLADHGRFGEASALFAHDAVVTIGSRQVAGRAGLSVWADECAAKNATRRTLHQVTNVRIKADGPDRAVGTAALTVHAVKDGRRTTFVDFVGELDDEYVRTPVGWRITRRRQVHLADA